MLEPLPIVQNDHPEVMAMVVDARPCFRQTTEASEGVGTGPKIGERVETAWGAVGVEEGVVGVMEAKSVEVGGVQQQARAFELERSCDKGAKKGWQRGGSVSAEMRRVGR